MAIEPDPALITGRLDQGRARLDQEGDGFVAVPVSMVYFAGLSNDSVYVNASYGGGEPQWVNLYGDGLLGCYGLLMTDPSNIIGDMAWTWRYASDGARYYNITLSVTTYSLGTHEVRFYAYDQETGRKISDVEVTNYAVLGTGGRFNDLNYMCDNTWSRWVG